MPETGDGLQAVATAFGRGLAPSAKFTTIFDTNRPEEHSGCDECSPRARSGRGGRGLPFRRFGAGQAYRRPSPAGILLLAGHGWVRCLPDGRRAITDTEMRSLGNEIALAAPKDAAAPAPIGQGFDPVGFVGDGKRATVGVGSVPGGKDGREAVDNPEAWNAVSRKPARARNARPALAFTGKARLGIVRQTDAVSGSKARAEGTFPPGTYQSIIRRAPRRAGLQAQQAPKLLACFRSADAAKRSEAPHSGPLPLSVSN